MTTIHRTTGEVAALLGTTEPRINDILRRGKLATTPPIRSGRRLWGPEHVRAVAYALGVDPAQLGLDRENGGGADAA